MDSNGDVWVEHRLANKLSKFRGSDGTPLGVFDCGKKPYTYSDATGLSLRHSIGPLGTWSVDFDSEADNSHRVLFPGTVVNLRGHMSKLKLEAQMMKIHGLLGRLWQMESQ